MRCKNCEYRLWALRTRECPECGRPFAPSEYEFVPGTVRFACPHCDQSYYGTAANGHLEPPEFHCVQCGAHIFMDEMVLFPAEGLSEESTRPQSLPWHERKKIGFVRAWLRMVGMGMVAPSKLIRMTPPESSLGSAWWFAIFTQMLFTLGTILPVMVFPLAAMFGRGALGRPGLAPICVGAFLLPAIAALVGIALWGLVAHSLLRLTGGTRYPLRRTYQALCYSSGANLLTGVPCLGMYLSLIGSVWWVVSAALMLREGQKVHGGRAALAALMVPLLAFGGGTFLLFKGITAARTAVTTTNITAAQMWQRSGTQLLVHALAAYAGDHGGGFPAHAIELINGNYIAGEYLLTSDPEAGAKQVPIGGTTLAQFEQGTLQQRQDAAARAVKSLPARVAAHRLGDFVFTYHGFKKGVGEGRLWLVISSPQASDPAAPPPGLVTVGLADGTVTEFPLSDLPARLAEQNRLRARHGLGPLPDPVSVTHTQPAASRAAERGPEE